MKVDVAPLDDVRVRQAIQTVRYLEWPRRMTSGDFGESIRVRTPVVDVLWPRLANTAILAAVASAVMVPLPSFSAFAPACDGLARVQRIVGVLEDHLQRGELSRGSAGDGGIADTIALEADSPVGRLPHSPGRAGKGSAGIPQGGEPENVTSTA